MRAVIAAALPFLVGAAVLAQDRPRARGDTTQDAPVPEVQGNGKTKVVPGEVGSNPGMGKSNATAIYDTKGMAFRARLVNADETLKNRSASVKVTVSGIQLVDPDSSRGQARQGEGHLAYRVDSGPVVATTATKLTFRQLPPDHHELLVELVANDETPLGPHEAIRFEVP